MKTAGILILVMLSAFTLPVFGQKQSATNLMAVDAAGNTGGDLDEPAGIPDTILTIDISGVECVDPFDDPDNTVLTECLGEGAFMTGVGWNVTLTTNGDSWLSECTAYFDGSDLDGSGLFLVFGVGDDSGGTMTYDSGGILDLTDNGIPNIEILADDLLYIQFFESFDDDPNGVDAVFGDGSFLDIAVAGYDAAACGNGPPEVPILDSVGLIVLALLLSVSGMVIARRQLRNRGSH